MSKQSSVHAKPASAPGSTRSNASLLQRQSTLGTHVCVQREAVGTTTEAPSPSLVREVMDTPGRPLDSATRSEMEPRFGFDFSRVRVHTDAEAAESARAMQANAYTAGEHVVFGQGKYAPGSPSGEGLIAHELTHVVQQASGPVAGTPVADGLSVSHPSDRFEQAASRTGAGLETPKEPSRPASLRSARPAEEGPTTVQRDPLSDTSGAGPFTARQTAASERSASAGETSANAGIASAIAGGVSALAGVVSAYAAIRSANFAERSAIAAEDPPVAEPTTGGLTVTDADISEIKGLDLKDVGEEGKDPDSVTTTTGKDVETPAGEDVQTTTGQDVETTKGGGQAAKKTTDKSATSKTKRAGTTTTRESTSKLFKPKDDTDVLKTYKVLNINQGENDSATFYASIRSNGKDIKDGGTEPPESTGYLGGTTESNASITFKARAGQHNKDGSASVRLLVGGTNVPPRKTLQNSSFFGSKGPEVNKNYGVQRFGGAITFDANPDGKQSDEDKKAGKPAAPKPPAVDKRLAAAAQSVGDGETTPLVTISLPDKFKPAVRKYEK